MAYYDITPTQLAQAAMTTSYATVYTVPASVRTFVKDITIVNTTSAAISIYVSLVPSGGTAGTSNAIFYANVLPANTTVDWCGAQILNESGFISVKASAVGCTIMVSGGEAQ
jgi:hypothetical protein